VSLASITAAASVPLWTTLYYGLLMPNPHVHGMVVIAVAGSGLIVAKHHENISRLLHGTENKMGVRPASGSES